MTDIIVINRNVFYEKKNGTCSMMEHIQKKYEEMLKSFTCFTTNSFTTPLNARAHHTEGYKGGRHGQLSCRNGKDDSYFHTKKKDLNKIMMGILNVLNHDNYNKMLNRIRLLKTDTNITAIINDILQKCSLQAFYLNIYIKLLHDILSHCTECERNNAIETINTYVKTYIDSREWMQLAVGDSCTEYDAFCDSQKQKSIVIAKNMILCELFKRFDLHMKQDEYIESLENSLDSLCQSSICREDSMHEEKAVVIVQMVTYLVRSNHSKKQTTFQTLIHKSEAWQETVISKKLKFLLEDLNSTIRTQKIEA